MNTRMMNNNSIYVKVANYGGYIANFTLRCQKFDGTIYNLDSGDFSVGFSRSLNIQPGTQYIYMVITVSIFGGTRIILEDYIDTAASSCYNLSGTIFEPVVSKVPCDGVGGLLVPPTNSNCCCCCNCCCQTNNCCNNPYMC